MLLALALLTGGCHQAQVAGGPPGQSIGIPVPQSGIPTTQPSAPAALGSLAVSIPATQPAVTPTASSPMAQRVEKLVEQLGNDNYAIREKATAELVALGKEILPLLDQVKSDDPEVTSRIVQIHDQLNPQPQPVNSTGDKYYGHGINRGVILLND